jgi:hypothetical protein
VRQDRSTGRRTGPKSPLPGYVRIQRVSQTGAVISPGMPSTGV